MYEGEILKHVLFFLFYFWMENFKSTFQQIAAVGIAEPIYNQIEFFSVKKKNPLNLEGSALLPTSPLILFDNITHTRSPSYHVLQEHN